MLIGVLWPAWLPGAERLGPSSRRTGIVISEIMYHPSTRTNAGGAEFVEIYNSQPIPENIGGWRLSGDWDYTFALGTILAPGQFLVVAPDPARVQAFYGIANVVGGFTTTTGGATNTLPNDGGTLRLRNRIGAVLLEVNYSDQPPWPPAADGAGHSLVLAQPSYGEGDSRAWAAGKNMNGSPGTAEPTDVEPRRNVVINELLANTDPSNLDFVELYNHSTQAVDISRCILTDDPDTNKFVIASDTVLPPRGFIVFNEAQLGFALKVSGDTVYLINSNWSRVLDVVRFDGQAHETSLGRFPDGAADFYPLTAQTSAATNAPPLLSDVVISEIMYNPISGDSDDEYVELHNRSAGTVNLGDGD